MVFDSLVGWAEICVEHVRLQTLLWWLGRRGADQWMDGWRRPNHMRSQIGGPKAMRPVSFRRLAGDFHSVAKQASFKTPFVRVPIRFWIDLGRFWEVQMEVQIYSGEVFRDAFAERVVESIFWWFFKGANRDFSAHSQCLVRIFTKSKFSKKREKTT